MSNEKDVEEALARVALDGCDGTNCNNSAHILAVAFRECREELSKVETMYVDAMSYLTTEQGRTNLANRRAEKAEVALAAKTQECEGLRAEVARKDMADAKIILAIDENNPSLAKFLLISRRAKTKEASGGE